MPNLTDGLDGLAMPVILVAACFAFISYVLVTLYFRISSTPYIPEHRGGNISKIYNWCLFGISLVHSTCKIFMYDTNLLGQ